MCSAEVDRNSISEQIDLLDEMIQMADLFDIQVENQDWEPKSVVRKRICRLSRSLLLTGTSLVRASFVSQP
ncbi:hypothetical protein HA466_0309350 [Hirschfeldia incana]|nr:hypothetical protein HA466_0309350 [Hirschfeldia incana]